MFMPILQVHSEDMPAYALVCGDPRRAQAIAAKLDNARELAFAREYRTFVGEFQGERIAVVSHGVGSAGAAVCFEELIRAGVTTLIRVGTAGSYSADIPAGSLVISTAAAREEGLTRQLVPVGYPAAADSAVVAALEQAAAAIWPEAAGTAAASAASVGAAASAGATAAGAAIAGAGAVGAAVAGAVGAASAGAATAGAGAIGAAASGAADCGASASLAPNARGAVVRKGFTVSYDAFFTGVEALPHKKYQQAGVLAAEMEIAALYVVASLRGARAGAIVAIDGFADSDLAQEYDPHTDAVAQAVEREIEIALSAITQLARTETQPS